MKVKELIASLQQIDGEAEIKIWNHSNGSSFETVDGTNTTIKSEVFVNADIDVDIKAISDKVTGKKYVCFGHKIFGHKKMNYDPLTVFISDGISANVSTNVVENKVIAVKPYNEKTAYDVHVN